MIAHLAGPIEAARALFVVSFRDDGLDRAEHLRLLLGELRPERLKLARPSPAGVAQLAEPHGVDGDEPDRPTGGNPFFVMEVPTAPGQVLPDTVREAVLARAGRLSEPARRLLDAVAIVPGPVNAWLLEGLAGELVEHVDECRASGMLVAGPADFTFRHELARAAVEGRRRRIAGWRCIARRSPPRTASATLTSPGSPITPTPPATRMRCSIGRRSSPSAPRSRGGRVVGARARVGGGASIYATNFEHADHDCADISALTTAQIRRYITAATCSSPVRNARTAAWRRAPGGAASLLDDRPAGDAAAAGGALRQVRRRVPPRRWHLRPGHVAAGVPDDRAGDGRRLELLASRPGHAARVGSGTPTLGPLREHESARQAVQRRLTRRPRRRV